MIHCPVNNLENYTINGNVIFIGKMIHYMGQHPHLPCGIKANMVKASLLHRSLTMNFFLKIISSPSYSIRLSNEVIMLAFKTKEQKFDFDGYFALGSYGKFGELSPKCFKITKNVDIWMLIMMKNFNETSRNVKIGMITHSRLEKL